MAKLSVTQKRWLLKLHLVFSAIMLGVTTVFLFLSILAANSNDESVIIACFTIMHKLANTSVRYSTIATLLTGILLSVLTQWGLFKFYWIIVKEALTLISILLGPIGMYVWTLKAVTMTSVNGVNPFQNPVFHVNSSQLQIGIILQIISLVLIFIISVFKPWGKRK